ncbi:hypothetical protein CQ062_13435 [Ochrobactrum sp. MYb68]|nr:hypothetical protein CQ062_13435 [Ochrobactrum sp. MYb68]
MNPKAKFDPNTGIFTIHENGTAITITLDAFEAAIDALEMAGHTPGLKDPSGTHYPLQIDAVAFTDNLALCMTFPDGTEGQFVLSTPGQHAHVLARAVDLIQLGLSVLKKSEGMVPKH